MGKCEHIIEKGKRKNQICGIYTNKTFNNKNYCSSHLASHKPNEEIKPQIIEQIQPQQPITNVEPEIKKTINIEPKSLDNGDSLDDVIQYEYNKIFCDDNNKNNISNCDLITKIDDLHNRLYFIENHLKYGKNKPMNIPEFEIWK